MYLAIGILWLVYCIIKEKIENKKIDEAICASKDVNGDVDWMKVNSILRD